MSSNFFFYSLHVTSAQALDLTAELEVSLDLSITQDTERIYYCWWSSHHLHHGLWV